MCYFPIKLTNIFPVSGAQLQSSVERPCPGERVTFTCRISSPAHRWQVSVFGITRSLVPGDWGGVITEPPFQFNVTEVIPSTSITSTATVTATPGLNGTLVVCQDGLGMLSDQSSIINVRGERGVSLYKYSGTSEIRTSRDLGKMSLFRMCP